jgi:hypothetical protein
MQLRFLLSVIFDLRSVTHNSLTLRLSNPWTTLPQCHQRVQLSQEQSKNAKLQKLVLVEHCVFYVCLSFFAALIMSLIPTEIFIRVHDHKLVLPQTWTNLRCSCAHVGHCVCSSVFEFEPF